MDMCRIKQRLFSPHTWTNGIGFYINWTMVLADAENTLPLEYPLEEPSWVPEFREGIVEPVVPDANAMLPPFTRPGLGFEIDKGLLRKYGKRFFKLTETRLKIKVIREKGLKAARGIKKRKENQS
jgi:L-alanine-DL-glutamate epimerase-like enolase superfamily enzyme